MIPHTLFPNKVRLVEDTHQYFDNNNNEYIGFSKLYGFLADKFDAEMIAGFVAKKEGTTQKEILNKWQGQTDEGTRIDKALELYANTGQILKTDEDLAPLIKKVLEKYSVYNKCYEQVVVYNDKFRTAGSLDKLGIKSNRKDSSFHISDFKRFEDGMSYEPKGQKWLNAPFEHYPNTKYTKITFQASYYAWHFEQLTGRKCERLFVDMIRPIRDKEGNITSYSNTQIPLMYIKRDIELLLEHTAMKVKYLLGLTVEKRMNNAVNDIIEEEMF